MTVLAERFLEFYGQRRLSPCPAELGYFYRAVNGGVVFMAERTIKRTEHVDIIDGDSYTQEVDEETILVGSIIEPGDTELLRTDEVPASLQYNADGEPTAAADVLNFYVYALSSKLQLNEALELGILGS